VTTRSRRELCKHNSLQTALWRILNTEIVYYSFLFCVLL